MPRQLISIGVSSILMFVSSGCEFRVGPPPPAPAIQGVAPSRFGRASEKFSWNGNSITVVIENTHVSSKSKRSTSDELHMGFDNHTVTITESGITVNGTSREFEAFSAVDIRIDPSGLRVDVDGQPFPEGAAASE